MDTDNENKDEVNPEADTSLEPIAPAMPGTEEEEELKKKEGEGNIE